MSWVPLVFCLTAVKPGSRRIWGMAGEGKSVGRGRSLASADATPLGVLDGYMEVLGEACR